MKPRLTTLERRAYAACDEIKRYAASGDAFHFAVWWKRSRDYGLCPVINYQGKKAAYCSGCGYDKLSAVVVEFLAPLCPGVDLGHGAGIPWVREKLASCGWQLVHKYDGKTEDAFSIQPLKP